jgi:hypothetical protein
MDNTWLDTHTARELFEKLQSEGWLHPKDAAPLKRLGAWLESFEQRTEALPPQHELREKGISTYNWHMAVIRDAKAAMEGREVQPLGTVYVTKANHRTADEVMGLTEPCGYCREPHKKGQTCPRCGYPDAHGDWARECGRCGRHPSNCACGV